MTLRTSNYTSGQRASGMGFADHGMTAQHDRWLKGMTINGHSPNIDPLSLKFTLPGGGVTYGKITSYVSAGNYLVDLYGNGPTRAVTTTGATVQVTVTPTAFILPTGTALWVAAYGTSYYALYDVSGMTIPAKIVSGSGVTHVCDFYANGYAARSTQTNVSVSTPQLATGQALTAGYKLAVVAHGGGYLCLTVPTWQ